MKNAKWISSPVDTNEAADGFVKRLRIGGERKIRKATLSVSAMGVYAAYLNGQRIGKNVLAPGWTSYNHRVQYKSYDVTSLMMEDNEIYIGVGQGWAVSKIGFGKERYFYTDRKALIALLDIKYTDGTCERIGTDESWEVYTTDVTYSEIYHGEVVDRTAEVKLLGNARLTEVNSKLIMQVGEDIIEDERIAPVSLIVTPKGERVIDFGQNMAGYVELYIKAPRGSRIVLHHAEVLDRDGNFYTENYRSARNECVYITSGEWESFKPTYTFQGFRYVHLVEYPFDTVSLDGFTAIAVNSDIKRTSHYVTGNPKINQLYHNVIWGQKSNYIDVPTDCPQRDERLGWTGDAQVFCRTAAINFNVEKFFKKWLGDVAIEQRERGGAVDGVVPLPCKGQTKTSAAWGDVACIAPWQIYLAYGNKKLLSEHFDMMCAWVDYLLGAGPERYLWLGGNHFGDWLAMDSFEGAYMGATSTDLIASAFFAYSTSLLIKAGDVLGIDVEYYRDAYTKIKKAFREYFMEDGMPKTEIYATSLDPNGETHPKSNGKGLTQTAIVLILKFGLCEEEERDGLVKKLCELIESNGGLMSTGFVGTPYILHVLSENGYTDVAYSLLFEERIPSWLYSVNCGATTMWEHWDGIKEDGSFWSKDMNSFNHYAYGAVFDWMFGVSSGIQPSEDAPGYKKIKIAPHPDRRLGFADASIDTSYGRVRSYWYYKGDSVYYEIEVPDECLADIYLPDGRHRQVCAGKYIFFESVKKDEKIEE